jgi:WLM domain
MTAAAQRALLHELLKQLAPLIAKHRLGDAFVCEPGLRLRRRYGMCRHRGRDQPALILVRCTADGNTGAWRKRGAIVGTLLHELAHLRHRSHSRAFWRLCRALLDEAAALGIYDAADDDPTEEAQGRGKLAGSAANSLAVASRRRALASAQLVSTWPIGATARVNVQRGPLAQTVVTVVQRRRTRLLVQALNGRRYVVSVGVLTPISEI